MSEPWESSLYPIVKNTLEENTDDEELSDDRINQIANKICRKFDALYIITKRSEP